MASTVRSGLIDSAALASGATGVIAMPISVVWETTRSRSGMWSCFITARACELSSAICTPCGQASVQAPLDEQ